MSVHVEWVGAATAVTLLLPGEQAADGQVLTDGCDIGIQVSASCSGLVIEGTGKEMREFAERLRMVLEELDAACPRTVKRRGDFNGCVPEGQEHGWCAVTAGGGIVGGPYITDACARLVADLFAWQFDGGLHTEKVLVEA